LVLEESWYLYPVPIIELADRNFNVWWDDYNHSLRRLNYGVRFYHFNFTGRKDYFKIITQLGYTERYGFQYSLPYLNRRKTIGANFSFDYHRNREVQYNTIENVQKFFRADDRFLLARFDAELSATYRPAYLTNHFFGLFYHQNLADAHVPQELNPDFFENGERLQRYFSVAYRFVYDERNIKPYPTDGRYFECWLVKDGLGIFDDVNILSADLDYREYSPFGKKWNLENIFKTRVSFIRQKPPYYNRTSLGFGRSFVRGYEHYIVDGLDYFLTKNSLRYEFLNKEFKFGKWVPIKAFRTLPIKAYLALNADAGIANNPYSTPVNSLDNDLLYGGGIGLNLVLYYNKVFKIEYSWNGLGEQGFFVHTELGF
jgi:outer membrane protein assembly factor BamA